MEITWDNFWESKKISKTCELRQFPFSSHFPYTSNEAPKLKTPVTSSLTVGTKNRDQNPDGDKQGSLFSNFSVFGRCPHFGCAYEYLKVGTLAHFKMFETAPKVGAGSFCCGGSSLCVRCKSRPLQGPSAAYACFLDLLAQYIGWLYMPPYCILYVPLVSQAYMLWPICWWA